MSVTTGVAKAAAGAKVLTGSRPTTRVFSKMKWTLVVALALLALTGLIAASQAPSAEHSSVGSKNSQSGAPVSEPAAAPQMSEKEALDAYEKLPLSFVSNEGQTDKAVRYYAQGAGYGFFFSNKGATLSFAEGKGRGQALGLDFLGADPHATLTAKKRLPGEVNYLVGDDPSEWQRGLQTHAELLYGGLWPGIDMAVRGEEGGNLKYEFHLKPGASVKDVRLGYRGAEGLSVGASGGLLVQTSLGVLKDAAPVSYQLIGGKRVPVKSRYELKGDGGYGFWVGAHDPRYPLIIDPGLDYSTFLGGTNGDPGRDIAVRDSRAYVVGTTASPNYPTTSGAFDTSFNGQTEAFVTKLNASGSALAYSTFLGGTEHEAGLGIAVRDGRAYVTGFTESTDYPTTSGAFDRTLDGSADAFVAKLNATGSKLAYSTFLGGTDFDVGGGIAVDGDGRAYVTGRTESSDFPTTRGAFDTSFNGGSAFSTGDAFAAKLNATGSALAYSTFLGGTEGEAGQGIAVDRDGRAYVTGETQSADYPTTPGAFDRTFNGINGEAFVTKLNATGSKLAYSTFLGGTDGDTGSDVAVRDGRAYVTGYTRSTDYPTTRGAFDTSFNGGVFGDDAFVTKLNATGSKLAYSTFLGGSSVDEGFGIAVDARGKAYVVGSTASTDYPTTPGAFDTTYNGGINRGDAFVTKLNATGSKLAYSTFLGGSADDEGERIAVDRDGRAYVTGFTNSTDYPTTPGAFDTSFNGLPVDAFVTKLPTG